MSLPRGSNSTPAVRRNSSRGISYSKIMRDRATLVSSWQHAKHRSPRSPFPSPLRDHLYTDSDENRNPAPPLLQHQCNREGNATVETMYLVTATY